MPAYIKLGDIKGESTDADHKEWIIIQSMSSPIYPSIPEGDTKSSDSFEFKDDGGTSADALPTEEITLGYTEVEWTYAKGDDAKGYYHEVEIHLEEPDAYTATDDLWL